MMNFGWEESNRYNSRKRNAQSTFFHLVHPTSYEPLERETRFPGASKVNFTHFLDHELLSECPATPQKLQKRPLDLQLSADEFIDHVEKLSRVGNGWSSVESEEDLKLSLSIGAGNIFEKRSFFSNHNVIDLEEGETRNFLRTKTCSSSHYVIDLEEPVDRMTGFAKSGPSLNSAFLEICPKVEHDLQGFSVIEPFLPTSVKKISSLDIAESNSFHEHSECCQEQTSSREGVSSKMGLFDLNKALLDCSCCCSESDDHTRVCPSQESSDGLNGSMEDGTCPLVFRKKETSGMFKQDKTVNLALLDLNKNSMDEEMWTPNSEDNSVVTLASPNSGNALILCSQNVRGDSDYIEDELSNGKEKSSEAEFLVHEVAELLIHISSVHSACVQQSNTKLKSEKPQNSLDSFELNTLNLTESYLDDDSVSSKTLEMNDNTDAKDIGVKLRRGRRMKDFQKEILPSLASLSRHEILEDINIMEGALRSREYRKNKGKMVSCGDNSSAPLRSRRARVNNGGRRNYPLK